MKIIFTAPFFFLGGGGSMYLFGTYGDQGQNQKGEQKDSIGEFLRLGCSTRKLVYKVFGKLLSAGTTEDVSKDAFLRT